MSNQTPGPWEAFTEGEFSGWWAIRQVTNDGLNHEVGSTDGGFEEADARLMAAAPDLLEALQAAVECGMVPVSTAKEGGATAHSQQVRVADQIREAIAKATGAA